MAKLSEYFENCLFFSVNSLARNINRISEQEFKSIGLNSSYAFLLMLVSENGVMSTGQIARAMNMDSSTITRFIDKLISLGYLNKKLEGRMTEISLTVKGKSIQVDIEGAWKRVYTNYKHVLGNDLTDNVTKNVAESNRRFEQK